MLQGDEGKAGDCEQRTPPVRDKFVQEEKIKILQNEVNIVCIVYDLSRPIPFNAYEHNEIIINVLNFKGFRKALLHSDGGRHHNPCIRLFNFST